jgi:hypothetical protein
MPFLGNVYIAPVAFNVTCSIAAAAISKSIIEYVFPKLKAQSFFFFFAFCPSMLAWSTAYNLKETFLLLLVVLFAKAMQLFLSGRYYIASIIACFACWMMHGIRFYSAFILMILYGVCAVVSWIAKNRISMSRIIVCGCILSACIFFATWILWGCDLDTYALKISATLNCFSISSPLKTLSLFWLHPLPLRLRLSSAYRILFASAVWTWALLPFCVVGVRKLWCETEQKFFCVFIFGFAVIMWIFYAFAIDGGLSSPRQRFQLEFTIALCQFAGICWAIEKWPLIKESLREWRTSFGKRRVTAPDKIALL